MKGGVLYRKEKKSPHSNLKFDGLFQGGVVRKQEWVVIEVARTATIGTKQQVDRQKVLEHAQVMLEAKRRYLHDVLRLRGSKLESHLRSFMVWGIVCQGLRIEIYKLAKFTNSLGVISSFKAEVPHDIEDLSGLFLIMKKIGLVAVG